MLAPAALHPLPTLRRRIAVAASAGTLCVSALLLLVLHPQNAATSQLSAARFFGGVDPQLARLMSPTLVAKEDDEEVGVTPSLPPPAHGPRSSTFYSDVSGSLARLMRKRDVLAEDAAELRGATAHVRTALPPLLPYHEAAALDSSVSDTAFQRVVSTVENLRGSASATAICHACVRAAAAAAKAKAAAAAKARAVHAAENNLQALRLKQRSDAAAAAARIAKQRALISKLQVRTACHSSFLPQSSLRKTIRSRRRRCSR
jgi:hypothetical protein